MGNTQLRWSEDDPEALVCRCHGCGNEFLLYVEDQRDTECPTCELERIRTKVVTTGTLEQAQAFGQITNWLNNQGE